MGEREREGGRGRGPWTGVRMTLFTSNGRRVVCEPPPRTREGGRCPPYKGHGLFGHLLNVRTYYKSALEKTTFERSTH